MLINVESEGFMFVQLEKVFNDLVNGRAHPNEIFSAPGYVTDNKVCHPNKQCQQLHVLLLREKLGIVILYMLLDIGYLKIFLKRFQVGIVNVNSLEGRVENAM
ncbi:hypothetical protein V6N13_083430 [Hibiscus sabdariffa]